MKSLIIIAVVLSSVSAFAADANLGKTSIGGLIGYTKPENVDGGISFGANVGHFITEEISVGGFFNYYKQSLSVLTVTLDSKLTRFGVEGSYHLADAPGLGLGVKLGLASVSSSSSVAGSTSASSSEFAFGPKVSYDYPVATSVTVGGEFNYMIISNLNTIDFLAAVKYWF